MCKQNLIKTSNEQNAQELIKLGYKLLSKQGFVYTFLNDNSLSFDNNKIKPAFSNNLMF